MWIQDSLYYKTKSRGLSISRNHSNKYTSRPHHSNSLFRCKINPLLNNSNFNRLDIGKLKRYGADQRIACVFVTRVS